MDRLVAKSRVAIAPRDFPRQHCAGRAIGVADRHVETNVPAMVDRFARLRDELAVEHVGYAMVLRLAPMDPDAGAGGGLVKQLGEVESLGLPMFDRLSAVEHLHLADHFIEAAITHGRHPFADFLGDEEEEVDDVFGLTDETLAQYGVLRRDPDRAGV